MDLPHSSQCPIVACYSSPIPAAPPPWLTLIRHEGTEGELKFRHVAGQLKLPGFTERFRNRHVQDEGPYHVLHNGDYPDKAKRSKDEK